MVTDPKKAASALEWAVVEMNAPIQEICRSGACATLSGYNKALEPDEKPMPQIVIIIDELADLMMVAPGEVEDSICRLAQLARAAGMHLVIATQRPSVNVITGIIKANIPTRIAFPGGFSGGQPHHHRPWRRGKAAGPRRYAVSCRPAFQQAACACRAPGFPTRKCIAIVEYIKERHEAAYDEDVIEHIEQRDTFRRGKGGGAASEYDARLPEAVEIVRGGRDRLRFPCCKGSMRVGYARAGRLIDEMDLRGIVSRGRRRKAPQGADYPGAVQPDV